MVQDLKAVPELRLTDDEGRHDVNPVAVYERPDAGLPAEWGSSAVTVGPVISRVSLLATSSTAQKSPTPRTSPTDG